MNYPASARPSSILKRIFRYACIWSKPCGGMEELKEEIRLKIVHPLAHPELYRAYGKPIGGGILMYAPPGCGKTHLARATAGEVRAHFLAVGIDDVLDMWIGASERNLHAIFEQARGHRPCVLFFDEVDALGTPGAGQAGRGRQTFSRSVAARSQQRMGAPGNPGGAQSPAPGLSVNVEVLLIHEPPEQQGRLGWFAAVLLLESSPVNIKLVHTLDAILIWGCILSTWAINFLAAVRLRK